MRVRGVALDAKPDRLPSIARTLFPRPPDGLVGIEGASLRLPTNSGSPYEQPPCYQRNPHPAQSTSSAAHPPQPDRAAGRRRPKAAHNSQAPCAGVQTIRVWASCRSDRRAWSGRSGRLCCRAATRPLPGSVPDTRPTSQESYAPSAAYPDCWPHATPARYRSGSMRHRNTGSRDVRATRKGCPGVAAKLVPATLS